MEGLILRSLGGFYTVRCDDGTVLECRGRGIFRRDSVTLLVGDRCTVQPTEEGCGSIEAIAPRTNYLLRPPLSNLTRLALVVSLAEPQPNPLVLDELTAIAQHRGIPVVFLFTKPDLAPADAWRTLYQKAGYPTAVINNLTGEGRAEAAALLCGGLTAFCGNSGAGKSSLLNTLFPTLMLPTGKISQKLGRGRHTTRHVELYENGTGGYIADTPGFSAIEFLQSEKMLAADLADCFPDFREAAAQCRFPGCSHRTERGCGVLQAVVEGRISESRHHSYCAIYEELKDVKEWELAKG